MPRALASLTVCPGSCWPPMRPTQPRGEAAALTVRVGAQQNVLQLALLLVDLLHRLAADLAARAARARAGAGTAALLGGWLGLEAWAKGVGGRERTLG